MFRRILVPLDGSERAERAIPIAARLARASGGIVILMRIISFPITVTEQSAEPIVFEDADESTARAVRYLTDLASGDVLAGIETETRVFKGIPALSIIAAARSSAADIIVMCSHGYTGATRWALGSVAEKIAFHAPVPVLVLRDGEPLLTGMQSNASQPLCVLVALDGSARAEEAIEPAANLAAALTSPARGALHLIHVASPGYASGQNGTLDENGANVQKARSYLSSTVVRMREGRLAPTVGKLLPVAWSVTQNEDVASSIIQAAEESQTAEGSGVFGGCTILAVATHGAGGLARWAMGSVTERILKASRLPVLIVRPLDMMERSNFTWDESALFTI